MIEVRNLVKDYTVFEKQSGRMTGIKALLFRKRRTIRALNDVSFSIRKGEVLGYVGPNGAGKSTTIKILTGILVPTGGAVTVRGNVPWQKRKENARHFGVVFGQRTQLFWDIAPLESFKLMRHLYQVPEPVFKRNLELFVDLLDMDPFIRQPVRQLSLGQKMRCELAMAFLHDPEIVFLDEPTIGLDVLAKDRIRKFLKKINSEKGVTIILTTHDLGDIESVCERMLMIDTGRIMWDGTITELKVRYGNSCRLEVEFDEEPQPGFCPPPARIVEESGPKKVMEFDRRELPAAELIYKIMSKSRVRDIFLQETRVEDIVRKIYLERKL